MANNTITINFETCGATSYIIQYRPIAGGAYRDGPTVTSSPAIFVDTLDAPGTQYEGTIQSDCDGALGNEIPFETEPVGGGDSDSEPPGSDSGSDSAPGSESDSGSETPPEFFFSFTEIPYSDPDFMAPGRGAEQWHNGSQAIDVPVEDAPLAALDRYQRWQWTQFETALDTYDWTEFDSVMEAAIDAGQKLSFGIMSLFTGAESGNATYDGFGSSYPEYLHDLMQADTGNEDYEVDGWWVPNFNSTHYLGRLRALHAALYAHILATSYVAEGGPHASEEIEFRDVIYAVDVRGFGEYGEWHTGSFAADWDDFPAGRQPTIATLKEIIDLHTEEFPDWPNQIMIAAFDSGASSFPIFHPYPEVGLYAINATNAWGPVGWRRDQWGDRSAYLDEILINNDITYLGSAEFSTYIMARYLTSPITGEPAGGVGGSPPYYSDIEEQIETYHGTSYGNGNWGTDMSVGTEADLARAAFKKSGYRYLLTGGGYAIDTNFTITLDWENIGIAPTYEEWLIVFELRDGVTVEWTGNSDKVMKLFNTGTDTHADEFPIGGLPSGTFDLYMIIKGVGIVNDEYRLPLPLAIEGRGLDGSYLLGSVTIP